MEYNIKAIETHYNGVDFRSRLEARWAAFFDVLNWPWTYEPVDFNGWIPDFAIYGKTLVYVEVKPVASFPRDVAAQIEASGCRDEVLIVGSQGPRPSDFDSQCSAIGWLAEVSGRDDVAADFWWEDAIIGYWSDGVGLGFCHACGGYTDRISGSYDGGSLPEVDYSTLQRAWRQACNMTRWAAGR